MFGQMERRGRFWTCKVADRISSEEILKRVKNESRVWSGTLGFGTRGTGVVTANYYYFEKLVFWDSSCISVIFGCLKTRRVKMNGNIGIKIDTGER